MPSADTTRSVTAATRTALPGAGDPNTLFVIDLSGYLFRAYHAMHPLSTSKGEPTQAVLVLTTMIQKMINELKPAMLAVALDSPGRTFRDELFADYKRPRREKQAEQPLEDMPQQFARVLQIVDAFGIPKFACPACEADDVIATLVRRAREHGLKTVIAAADKDMMQLIADDVIMYDTMRERVYGTAETVEKMGVPPSQVRDLLALMGDTSDNVPGVPSVGPKTATTLLQQYGSLDGIYAHVGEISRAALRDKLIEHKDNAFLSRELVSLRDDIDIPFDVERLRYKGGDEARLRELFIELEFTRLIGQMKPPPREPGRYDIVTTMQALDEALAEAKKRGKLALFPAVEDEDAVVGELVGIALASEENHAIYVPLGHRTLDAPAQLGASDVITRVRPLLEDAQLRKYSSDIKRDEELFSRYGVELRGVAFDTMLASYLVDAEKHSHALPEIARSELQMDLPTYDQITDKQRGTRKRLEETSVERGRDYAAQRAVAILRAAQVLGPRIEGEGFAKLMYDIELPLAHVLADMEMTGMLLDIGLLEKKSKEAEVQIIELERRCTELAGRVFNVGSPKQLETVLFDELKLPAGKRTKKGRSTDHEVLEELACNHELPAKILEHRQLSKLRGTYLDALPRQANAKTKRIHTRYNQAVAATGRLSSSDPNLQNIPIRTEIGRSIREAFIAREGWEILAADYSQIELRILAHMSDDPELVDAFRTAEDVHIRTATALFDVSRDGVTREMRGQAKTVNFAVIYGQTQFALARNLKIEKKEAKRYIDAFFARYAGVTRLLDKIIEDARRTGEIRTLLGRRRLIPDLQSRNHGLRSGAERMARNAPIQGSAADIMKLAMVHIHRDMEARKLASKMLLTVHDELVFEVPPQEKEQMAELVRTRMENAFTLSVPLVVDLGWGPTWGQAH